MINGIDVSHWSSDFTIHNSGANIAFAIIKATEGRNMIDKKVDYFTKEAERCEKEIGFYHFAHPEINSAEVEANHFVYTVERYLNGQRLLALDIEGKALQVKTIDDWSRKFCDTVFGLTGIRPVLYVQESSVTKFKKVAEGNYGLWVAKWVKNPLNAKPKTGSFPFYALWQWSGGSEDYDIFNGTINQFRKYGERV